MEKESTFKFKLTLFYLLAFTAAQAPDRFEFKFKTYVFEQMQFLSAMAQRQYFLFDSVNRSQLTMSDTSLVQSSPALGVVAGDFRPESFLKQGIHKPFELERSRA